MAPIVTVFFGRERGGGSPQDRFFVKLHKALLGELHQFRNDKNLNAFAVFAVIAMHMNEDGWSSVSIEEIRDITKLKGDQAVSDALRVLRDIRLDGEPLLHHYRVRYPSGRWGESYYHIHPGDGGADHAPADNLVLWNPPKATPGLSGGGLSAATPRLSTDGKPGGIYKESEKNTDSPDRSGERLNTLRWKLAFVMQSDFWGVNPEDHSDDKDALEEKAAVDNIHDDDRCVVLASHQQPKPYHFYDNKFWVIRKSEAVVGRTLVKAVAERLIQKWSEAEYNAGVQFDLYRPSGELLYSLINGKKPAVQRPADTLLDAITQFCFKQATTREEINALCPRCAVAKKELLGYLEEKYPDTDKRQFALDAATKAIQNDMPSWYEKNKLTGTGKPLNRPQPRKFLDAFLEFREWLIANPPKRAAGAASKARFVEYGVTKEGQHVLIRDGEPRNHFVSTYMVKEEDNA